MHPILRRFLGAKTGKWAVVQTALANVAVQGVNLASGILTARTLGPGGRGALAGIIMWPQFLAYAMTVGIPVASVYWLKRKPASARELAGTGLLLSVVLGTLAALVGFALIPYSLHTYPPSVVHLARLWALVTPLELLAVTLIAQVQAAGAFSKYNLFRFFSPFSVLACLLVEKATGHLTYTTAAFSYLVAGLPAMVWVGWWCWSHYRPSFRDLVPTSKVLLGYGVRAWGSDLLGTIANQVDRILVVGLLNPEAMGLYVVAQSVAGVLAVLPAAVSPITLPRSSGMDAVGILALTGAAVRATLYVMVLAAVPLLLLGGVLIHLVYGPKFSVAAAVLPFLILEAIADGLTSVLAQAFLASGLPGTVTMLQGVGVLTSVPLLYLLIPRYGLRGAGCALMIATFCRLALVLANFPFRLHSRPPGLIMPRDEWLGWVGRVWKPTTSSIN